MMAILFLTYRRQHFPGTKSRLHLNQIGQIFVALVLSEPDHQTPNSNTMEPKIAQKGPFAVDLEEGQTYHWCACGRSKNQPFCDGSHEGTGFTPVAFAPEKSGKAYLCGCKHSKNKPYCDGTHNTL